MTAAEQETLDPGPVVHAGVEFAHVHHKETGGEADVPAHLLDHYHQRGWEPTDSPVVVEPDLEPDDAAEDPQDPDLDEPDEDLNEDLEDKEN